MLTKNSHNQPIFQMLVGLSGKFPNSPKNIDLYLKDFT